MIAKDTAEMVYLATPADANTIGTVFGGRIMELMDMVAAICARRHSQRRVATLAVVDAKFLRPLHVGDVINIYAKVNRTFNTSMEVGLKVVGEDTYRREQFHAASAYFIIVTLDDENKPVKMPEFVPRTDVEKRRWQEAGERRKRWGIKKE